MSDAPSDDGFGFWRFCPRDVSGPLLSLCSALWLSAKTKVTKASRVSWDSVNDQSPSGVGYVGV